MSNPPQVDVRKLRGHWRLVDAGTRRIARIEDTTHPRDGGGVGDRATRMRQKGYVNDALAAKWLRTHGNTGAHIWQYTQDPARRGLI